ncbi:osm-3 [Acrasis kona]|uniref:Osm-3 n=1 Tax=Acrasis kona TaxID=1008807 RepID=A0AAW2Z9Q9_9EUKA
MQSATQNLQWEMQRAQTKLLTLRLDLQSRLEMEYLNGNHDELNPFSLLDRLRVLEDKSVEMEQKCVEIIKAKEIALTFTENVLIEQNRRYIQELSKEDLRSDPKVEVIRQMSACIKEKKAETHLKF